MGHSVVNITAKPSLCTQTCSESVVFDSVLAWSGSAWAPPSQSSSPRAMRMVDDDTMMEQYQQQHQHHHPMMHPSVHHSLAELEAVLPHVRFPLMSAEELNNIAGHPLASASSVLQMLLGEARGSGCASEVGVYTCVLVQQCSVLAKVHMCA